MTDRSALRTHLRKTRRELSPVEQADHAEALATHISTHRLFFNSHRIACYFPVDGEIDPYPL
ncbi:MAG: 5-formyltetrahydrofolate cyclo-ligase, partial [Gammaproteobacteria bacterium]|nr:5-formyltetrahydrofolate cyclo-ligase [Gammaproteobacteria bacterium]